MRVLKIIIQKEFLQIFRNRMMLPIIFVMPLVQLILLSYAATLEIRNIDLYVIDQDQSAASRQLTDSFRAAGRFRMAGWSVNPRDATDALIRNEAKMALHIPVHFERDLHLGGSVQVQLIVDAIDGYSAGIAWQYAAAIIGNFNKGRQQAYRILQPLMSPQEIAVPLTLQAMPSIAPLQTSRIIQDARIVPVQVQVPGPGVGSDEALSPAQVPAAPRIEVSYSHWYNPELDFKLYMVPGILVLLVTMIGGFLSGMNIVREREMGTMEQINVTPVRKYEFIAGKLLPFWILGLAELSFGLIVAVLLFDVPVSGSLLLIYTVAGIYLAGILGLGLLISTLTDTQQQAMFITWFLFVVFILLSGLFTPIDSMPGWAQNLTWFNPVAWFIDVMRRVLLTGAGTADVAGPVLVLAAFAGSMIVMSVLRYKKSTA